MNSDTINATIALKLFGIVTGCIDGAYVGPDYTTDPVESRKVQMWLAERYEYRLMSPQSKDTQWHCGCDVKGYMRFPIDTDRPGDIWTSADTPEMAIALAAMEAIKNG